VGCCFPPWPVGIVPVTQDSLRWPVELVGVQVPCSVEMDVFLMLFLESVQELGQIAQRPHTGGLSVLPL
jgi:hypothetical protein